MMRSLYLGLVTASMLAGASALAAPAIGVRTQVAREHTLVDTAQAYGQLVPNPHTLQWFSAAQAGRIADVLVTPGSRVRPGQVLIRIDPTPQTRAAYASARSALVSARAKLKQAETLEKNGLATKSDLESARSAFVSAQSRLAALRAEGVSSKAYELKAGSGGVVTRLTVSRGQWVSAGSRIAALAPRGELWVRLGLEPSEAARVKAGAHVRLTPVFGSAATIRSKVVRVAAQASAATGLIDAEVPVSSTASGPVSGEWVSARITLRTRTLPAVPRSAVLKDARGYYVFVVRDGVAHRVGVKPLIRARGLVGLAGIKAGERVVTEGNFELHDGEAVRETGP